MTVGSGPWAGTPLPDGMLDGPRRPKDAADLARLRAALASPRP